MDIPGVEPGQGQPVARRGRVLGRRAVFIQEALAGALSVHATPTVADLDRELVTRLANDG